MFPALEPDLLDLLNITWLEGCGVLLFCCVGCSFNSAGHFLLGWKQAEATMFGREAGLGAGGETGGQVGPDEGGLVCGGDDTSLARVEFASGTGSDKEEIFGKKL